MVGVGVKEFASMSTRQELVPLASKAVLRARLYWAKQWVFGTGHSAVVQRPSFLDWPTGFLGCAGVLFLKWPKVHPGLSLTGSNLL